MGRSKKRSCFICKIRQCESRNSLYSFPKDPNLRQKWLEVCGLDINHDVKNIKICSAHFDSDDFEDNGLTLHWGIRKLSNGAVPLTQTHDNSNEGFLETSLPSMVEATLHERIETALDNSIDTCSNEKSDSLEDCSYNDSIPPQQCSAELETNVFQSLIMTNMDLHAVLAELTEKNTELKKNLAYQQHAREKDKLKHEALKDRLLKLTEQLQKNRQIYKQLIDDVTHGIHMGTNSTSWLSPTPQNSYVNPVVILNSPEGPALKKRSLGIHTPLKVIRSPHRDIPKRETAPKQDVGSPCQSNVNVYITRRKMLNIQPLNMEELAIEAEMDEEIENEETQPSTANGLSTIIEEDSSSKREVTILLNRLSDRVVESHLIKQASTLNSVNNSVISLAESFNEPDSSSTSVSKMELMQGLGLTPVARKNNFVSVRRKDTASNRLRTSIKKELSLGTVNENGVSPQTTTDLSPKIKSNELSPKRSSREKPNLRSSFVSKPELNELSPKSISKNVVHERKKYREEILKSPGKKTKKKKLSPKVSSVKEKSPGKTLDGDTGGRPKRRARPTQLQDASLKKKMRRS